MKEMLTEKDKNILSEICEDPKDILIIEKLLKIEKEYDLSGRRSGIYERIKEQIIQ